MNKVKHDLINKAKKIYKEIYPCGAKSSIHDCFTSIEQGKKIVFWFNTKDNDTHIMISEIN